MNITVIRSNYRNDKCCCLISAQNIMRNYRKCPKFLWFCYTIHCFVATLENCLLGNLTVFMYSMYSSVNAGVGFLLNNSIMSFGNITPWVIAVTYDNYSY